ncbi:glycosyltransferase [Cellulomonas sp. S1-8]|uniref:glycosyltransferase n=1 Tax=Cellulomonas sp. S1-8 TaxID=2904790 RepID=UPI0022449EB8|nr:glycosyltransferase family 2 protein [Cellulomonas sp. S1-8]UZN04636.1 glycosyltransferase family 2 protein [Cellulomonas sp. S1-8]
MSDGTWHALLVAVLVALVAIGLLPAVGGIYQYLLVPVHGFRNHLDRAAPRLPRVAVIVPAWNEGAVLAASIERLMRLQYPPERLRVFVVDDASTDDTPDVVRAKSAEYPGRIVLLRREQGGQGKAHTLNHGIAHLLTDDWMEALLIMDADVIYRPDALRRMTRHLADERVGAVTAYIREGSRHPGAVARFIGFEYVTAQACARRAQNVMGAIACLAGGAQLHTRANLEAVGGRIDTSTLAEDTFTTFLTQLDGRKVVFDGHAVVLAEEPDSVRALWKQRVRWARGNVQITHRFRHVWFRPSRVQRLGSVDFGVVWFSVFALPFTLIAASVGLIGLYFASPGTAAAIFGELWWFGIATYLFITVTTLLVDLETARRSWFEGLLFPGVGALALVVASADPQLWEVQVPELLGLQMTPTGIAVGTLLLYSWPVLSMVLARLVHDLEGRPVLGVLSKPLLYLVGYGPLLCAITLAAYVREWRGAEQTWDKTEKTGTVAG